MVSAEWVPRPFVVGEENVYIVGVQGVVEARTMDTITIAGVTLPMRMGGGVKYLSTIWPDDDPCGRDHCGSECDPEPAPSEALDDLATLTGLIRDRHEVSHNSAMRFCPDLICREAWDLTAEGAS